MASVENEQEGEDQVAEDLAAKLAFERGFSADVRKLLHDMGFEAAATYAATGAILDFLTRYNTDMQGTLKKHYRLISRKFGANLEPDVEKLAITDTLRRKIRDAVNFNISNHIDKRAKDSAKKILITSQKKLEDKIISELVAGAREATPPTREDIADKIRSDAEENSDNRADTIATTETNEMAEGSKEIEAETIAGSVAASIAFIEKTWNTILDEVTRPAHVAADLQTVPIHELFIVGGERLKYPCDTSHGASAGNVINCRCSVTYRLRTSTAMP